jgi:hypothetical protein
VSSVGWAPWLGEIGLLKLRLNDRGEALIAEWAAASGGSSKRQRPGASVAAHLTLLMADS